MRDGLGRRAVTHVPQERHIDGEIVFRKAAPGDFQALCDLYNGIGAWLHDAKGIADQWWRTVPEAEIHALIAAEMSYVAVLGEEIVGAVKITEHAGPPWEDAAEPAYYAHSLAVKREYAGMGIGRQILDWLEALARRNGKAYLRLDCMADNPRLRRYYAEAGFRSLGRHREYTWYALFEKRVA